MNWVKQIYGVRHFFALDGEDKGWALILCLFVLAVVGVIVYETFFCPIHVGTQ